MTETPGLAELTWIDWVLLVVLVSSTLLAVLRGFVQEIAGVAIWAIALLAAYKLYGYAAAPLAELLSEPLPQVLGFVGVVLLVLLLGKMVRLALKELVTAWGGNRPVSRRALWHRPGPRNLGCTGRTHFAHPPAC
jgi:uncharacterized membrane protein required for colicin V production